MDKTIESKPITFKTSLYGFNKDEVIDYIEENNNRYRRMEATYLQEIAQLKSTNKSDEYEKIIIDLKAEIETLTAKLASSIPESYREKADLYDKMSSQLGSMIILANEKADDIVDTANKRIDEAKQDMRVQIDSINNQLYNEFILTVESYSDEFVEFNKLLNNVLGMLNAKTVEIKNKFDKKNIELKQTLINEINSLKLFDGEGVELAEKEDTNETE